MTNRKRRDPIPEVSQEEKDGWLDLLRHYLEPGWLASDGTHPLQQLWSRPDWIATTELYTLGHALAQLQPKCEPQVRGLTRKMRDTDPGNVAGAVWEVICASMFAAGGHGVALAPKNRPVWDFSVECPTGPLLVSCKCLFSSERELLFRSFFKALADELSHNLLPSDRVLVAVHGDVMSIPVAKRAKFVRSVLQLVSDARRSGIASASNRKSDVTVAPLGPLLPLPYSLNSPSYTLVGTSPLGKNEQYRFERKIQEASMQILKSDSATPHLVAMRVPSYVDLDAAAAWFDEYSRKQPSGSLAGVMVYRCSIAKTHSEASDTSRALVHEVRLLSNDSASRSLAGIAPSGGFRLCVPIGFTSDRPTKTVLNYGGRSFPILGRYVYVSGSHVYHKHAKDGAVELVLPEYPDISTDVEISGIGKSNSERMRISARRPRADELAVL